MQLNKVWNIIISSWQRELRNKTVLFFTITTFVVLYGINELFQFINLYLDFGPFTSKITDEKVRIYIMISSFWSSLVSIYLGSFCIRNDWESGVLSQIISLPIRRFEYVVGRILGSWSMIFIIQILICLYISLTNSSSSFCYTFIATLVNSFSSLFLITITCLLSLYFPKFAVFFMSLFINSMIYSSDSLVNSDHLTLFSSGKQIFIKSIYWLFPRLGSFQNIVRSLLEDNIQSVENISFTLFHGFLSMSILFLLLCYCVQKMDASRTQ